MNTAESVICLGTSGQSRLGYGLCEVTAQATLCITARYNKDDLAKELACLQSYTLDIFPPHNIKSTDNCHNSSGPHQVIAAKTD